MRIVTARSIDEVRSLQSAWNGHHGVDVNADLDYFLSAIETREEVVRPHVVSTEVDGAPHSLLVARLERVVLPVRFGYKQLYGPRLRTLTVVQGGVRAPDDAHVEPLFDEVRAALADREADVIRLRLLRIGTKLHGLARTRASWLTRDHHSRPSRHWRLRLPGSLDEVLRAQSARTRANHRRYARKLEEELGPRLSCRVFRDPADLPQLIRDVEKVAVKTYQHRLGAGFGGDEADGRLLALAAERGWLRAYLLYVDGAPAAFWLGHAYRRTFFTGPTGYDPKLAHLRLGTYVLMKMIEDLCGDNDVDYVDYGFGEAEYKRHFGDESWLEEDVLVFAPTVRGVRVNLARAGLLTMADAFRRVSERTPFLRGVKRGWRIRLSSRGESAAETG